ncbi:MAG: hypothetical protein E6R03_17480 [Hyphomicrobiaceae bacterium]|nr:MAG: hypothetical protein E6R03_17480 [Hyphomicrobiaceae bacterium]
METTAVDFYALAEQIARKQVMVQALENDIAELKQHFRNRPTTRYESEGKIPITVKVTPNKRIDDRLARENLEPEQYEAVSKKTIDTAKARAFLSDAELESITRVYENKVEVTI